MTQSSDPLAEREGAAQVCTHRDGERALEVRPCTRCGTFICKKCDAFGTPYCVPCRTMILEPINRRTRRFARAGQITSIAGIVGAVLLVVGAPLVVCLGVACVGGAAAGIWGGTKTVTRIAYVLSSTLTTVGMALAPVFIAMVSPRLMVIAFSVFLGGSPGFFLTLWLSRRLRRFELPAHSVDIINTTTPT